MPDKKQRFKGKTLSLRVELMNVFNRTQTPNPTGVNLDFTSPMFGYTSNAINTSGQRTGQIVMRFNF
jgi:hypothetical protein